MKAENILLDDASDPQLGEGVFIADFGLSEFAAPQEKMSIVRGTLAYVGECADSRTRALAPTQALTRSLAHSLSSMPLAPAAPEVLMMQSQTTAVDLWGVGICTFMMCARLLGLCRVRLCVPRQRKACPAACCAVLLCATMSAVWTGTTRSRAPQAERSPAVPARRQQPPHRPHRGLPRGLLRTRVGHRLPAGFVGSLSLLC